MTYVSSSKSQSIRDIEDRYKINLSTCSKDQLDSLTSSSSKYKAIHKLSDLMINTNQFDLANMTDVERKNLKYLVMSTDEVLDILKRKASSIYYKPCQTRLRARMTYDDFYQSCAFKVMLNDGILRFNADYKLEPAIHCWLLRNAMWQTYKKSGHEDDLLVLDSPVKGDTGCTLLDMISISGLNVCSVDYKNRIKYILQQTSKEESNFIVLKAGNTQVPMSEYNIARLFIVYQMGKKELSKIMYNTKTGKLVSNQIFNKFYKQTLMRIASIIRDEANFCGEKFSLNQEDL